ncbi:MAG: hypothetical protein ISR55_05325 [Bacteroidetes bacterium]|nr:hypothetical protein [Bacteroidota bacterium]
MRLKYISLLLIFVLFGFQTIAVQQIKRNKRFVRTYKIKPETRVEVYNKYGQVEIIHWQKDSVKYIIKLETRAKSKEKIDKLEALLNFSFQSGENYIRAKTLIGNEAKDLMSEITNLTNAIFTIGAEVDIDFTVYLPATNKLKIQNSFGDVFMGNIDPDIQIELSHGDLRAGKLNSHSIIDIKFGHAFIEFMKEGEVKLNYADLALSAADELDIKSKASSIDISNVDALSIDSRRDEYKIGQLNSLNGSSNFSKINIMKFDNELKLSLKYGSFSIIKISRLFSSVNISSGYTDITLIFERGSAYDFLLTSTDVSFSYPKEKLSLTKKEIDRDKRKYNYKGTLGQNTKSNVIILSEKGSVKVFQE